MQQRLGGNFVTLGTVARMYIQWILRIHRILWGLGRKVSAFSAIWLEVTEARIESELKECRFPAEMLGRDWAPKPESSDDTLASISDFFLVFWAATSLLFWCVTRIEPLVPGGTKSSSLSLAKFFFGFLLTLVSRRGPGACWLTPSVGQRPQPVRSVQVSCPSGCRFRRWPDWFL